MVAPSSCPSRGLSYFLATTIEHFFPVILLRMFILCIHGCNLCDFSLWYLNGQSLTCDSSSVNSLSSHVISHCFLRILTALGMLINQAKSNVCSFKWIAYLMLFGINTFKI